ncbi:hypothetical protein ACJMK2_020943 [Sinanodonta woodiana]|uniref:Uncharacterized protein n=1 Tax=Sinanodonta woodiana TaxID=1069815 RepID=A0ABD3U121_SINWO
MSASIGQEVSDMLAAALEQMDGIIANTRFDSQNGPISITSPSRPQRYTQYSRVIKLLEDLKLALELCEDRKRVVRQMPTDVLKYVLTWLSYTDEACKVGFRGGMGVGAT